MYNEVGERNMERIKKIWVVAALLLVSSSISAHSRVEMIDLKVERVGDDVVITIETAAPVDYRSFTLRNPPRTVVDITGVAFKRAPLSLEVEGIATVSATQYRPDIVRVVADLARPMEAKVSRRRNKIFLRLRVGKELIAEKRAVESAIEAVREDAGLRAREAAREREKAARITDREAMRRLEEIRRLLDEGKIYLEKGKFTEAAEKFEEVLFLDPGNRVALVYFARASDEAAISEHLLRAQRHFNEGRFHDAITELEKILELSPRHRSAEDLIFTAQKALLDREVEIAKIETGLVRREMMAAVERAAQPMIDYFAAPPPRRVIGELPEEVYRHRAQLLGREVSEFTFKGTPIRDVLSFLSEASGVTIVLDEREIWALHRVTALTVNPMPLSSALSILLRPRGWGYAVKEHYIWVSTKERLALGGGGNPHGGHGGGRTRRDIDRVILQEFEFIGVDLREILSFLARESGISIVMDNELLEEVTKKVVVGEELIDGEITEITEEMTVMKAPAVTVSTVNPMPLSAALSVILRPGGMGYAAEEHYIWVSTEEKIAAGEEGRRVTRFFQLRHPVHREKR